MKSINGPQADNALNDQDGLIARITKPTKQAT